MLKPGFKKEDKRLMINSLKEEEALLVLHNQAKLSSQKLRHLIEELGSAKAVLEACEELKIAGLKNWEQESLWKKDLEAVQKDAIKIISFQNKLYPKTFQDIKDAPLVLYCKGNLEAIDTQGISIIGTRTASVYGLEMAEKISRELSLKNFTIISGLARGIDTKAHLAAINEGRSLAFIGSGLSNIYPKENEYLAEKISQNGACISEMPMYTSPQRYLFPKRNRLVSAMGQASVLIEAPIKSGAMITMRLALEQDKKTFTIPGRIDTPSFAGNHSLIKKRTANLVENSSDILQSLDYHPSQGRDQKREKEHQDFLLPLNQEEEHLLGLMPGEEVHVESIAANCSIELFRLNALLTSLVMKRYVKEYPGKIFKKV